MGKVVALVGMPGSGKSQAAEVFEARGFIRVRFGDVTDVEVKKRGLELNENNERVVRELLRKEHGMAAYAKLNLPRIEEVLKQSDVALDGLYSWEEYKFLKARLGNNFLVVAIWASPRTRYARLAGRAIRPLTAQEAASRDSAEIENLNKGGPIAVADYTITNEYSLENLKNDTVRIINCIRGKC